MPKRAIMAGETLESVEIIDNMARALPGLVASGVISTSELPLLRALLSALSSTANLSNLPLDAFFGGSQVAL